VVETIVRSFGRRFAPSPVRPLGTMVPGSVTKEAMPGVEPDCCPVQEVKGIGCRRRCLGRPMGIGGPGMVWSRWMDRESHNGARGCQWRATARFREGSWSAAGKVSG